MSFFGRKGFPQFHPKLIMFFGTALSGFNLDPEPHAGDGES